MIVQLETIMTEGAVVEEVAFRLSEWRTGFIILNISFALVLPWISFILFLTFFCLCLRLLRWNTHWRLIFDIPVSVVRESPDYWEVMGFKACIFAYFICATFLILITQTYFVLQYDFLHHEVILFQLRLLSSQIRLFERKWFLLDVDRPILSDDSLMNR